MPAHFASRTLFLRIAVLGLLTVVLVLGWREFLFLCDDAYITFRYIDHHRRGWGYVWNPPPFLPVEGYSNFLWMLLLHGLWNLTGLDPTRTANWVSLIVSMGTLALGYLTIWELDWPERLARHRFALTACALGFAVSNRTFVTWTSSGLETALFGFCVMLWIFGALRAGRSNAQRDWLAMSAGAASAALTRPDGLLLVLASLGLLLISAWRGVGRKQVLIGAAPLALVPIHLLWRRSFYGEWLPNTYYAKHVRIWPDSGVRYVESFVLEHALWTWLLLAAAVVFVQVRQLNRDGLPPGALGSWLAPTVVLLTLVTHVAYYALIIGGDHFEYRILAHLIVPLGVALVWLLTRLPIRPALLYGIALLVVAPGIPIPWIHHARSNARATRAEAHVLIVSVADAFPEGPLRSYAEAFDRLQAWMIPHHVGMRQQEHKVFAESELATFPTRAEGEQIKWEQRAVISVAAVGLVGWILPEVAVIDLLGLNDWVVARNPVADNGFRAMAHERSSPPGYPECFKPDVAMDYNGGRVLHWTPRAVPLTDSEIEGCERHFMELAKTWKQD